MDLLINDFVKFPFHQYPGFLPDRLQMIALKSLSVEDCQARYVYVNPVFDSQICSLTKNGEGACHVSEIILLRFNFYFLFLYFMSKCLIGSTSYIISLNSKTAIQGCLLNIAMLPSSENSSWGQ